MLHKSYGDSSKIFQILKEHLTNGIQVRAEEKKWEEVKAAVGNVCMEVKEHDNGSAHIFFSHCSHGKAFE